MTNTIHKIWRVPDHNASHLDILIIRVNILELDCWAKNQQWNKLCLECFLDQLHDVKEGNLGRAKFAALMSSTTASSRREYDVVGHVMAQQ